jgi:hypothetical protein
VEREDGGEVSVWLVIGVLALALGLLLLLRRRLGRRWFAARSATD